MGSVHPKKKALSFTLIQKTALQVVPSKAHMPSFLPGSASSLWLSLDIHMHRETLASNAPHISKAKWGEVREIFSLS